MDATADRCAEFAPVMPAQAKQSRLHRIDPLSQWTIRRFLIKLATVGIYAAFIVKQPAIDSALLLASVNILIAVAIAVLHREPWNDGPLNHWDEAVAFTGLCAFAHVLKLTLGGG